MKTYLSSAGFTVYAASITGTKSPFQRRFPISRMFRAQLLSLLFLLGVSNEGAENRCSCCLLTLWLFWFLHLPGGYGAFCGVFVSGRRSHVSRAHLHIRVQHIHNKQYTVYNVADNMLHVEVQMEKKML